MKQWVTKGTQPCFRGKVVSCQVLQKPTSVLRIQATWSPKLELSIYRPPYAGVPTCISKSYLYIKVKVAFVALSFLLKIHRNNPVIMNIPGVKTEFWNTAFHKFIQSLSFTEIEHYCGKFWAFRKCQVDGMPVFRAMWIRFALFTLIMKTSVSVWEINLELLELHLQDNTQVSASFLSTIEEQLGFVTSVVAAAATQVSNVLL